MRRGRREMVAKVKGRQAPRLAGSGARSIRLVGQTLEWSYRYFDDRSGSEKLTE
jgi:hypothetical protein